MLASHWFQAQECAPWSATLSTLLPTLACARVHITHIVPAAVTGADNHGAQCQVPGGTLHPPAHLVEKKAINLYKKNGSSFPVGQRRWSCKRIASCVVDTSPAMWVGRVRIV